jgi:hypothetical protein
LFYLFAERVGVRYDYGTRHHLLQFEELAKSAFMWWPFNGACFMSERPTELYFDEQHRLHRDGGPAILFPDRYALWALHGVRVTQELAEISPQQMEPGMVMKTDNANVRREALRKMTPAMFLEKAGAQPVDEEVLVSGDGQIHPYQLYMLDVGDGQRRPYIKMKNPSLEDTYHVEGVHPSCRTVRQALAWQDGLDEFMTPDWVA